MAWDSEGLLCAPTAPECSQDGTQMFIVLVYLHHLCLSSYGLLGEQGIYLIHLWILSSQHRTWSRVESEHSGKTDKWLDEWTNGK